MSRAPRGQALVLFALLMLSALLMSFMTISFAARAKDRLELQAAAVGKEAIARYERCVAVLHRQADGSDAAVPLEAVAFERQPA